jgi:hypothetical protein
VEAFRNLDPESIYTRLFRKKNELTDAELKTITDVDFENTVALVLTVPAAQGEETVIGAGRYVLYDPPNDLHSAIVVLNAGSSSVKFSLCLDRGETLERDAVGHIEGLYTAAHFVSKAPDGTVKAKESWPNGFELGYDGALDHLVGHLRSELINDRLVGIAHRVVHGGQAYKWPVRLDEEVLSRLETFFPLTAHEDPQRLPRSRGNPLSDGSVRDVRPCH